MIDPTYLRTIHDGLLSSAIHKDNASALPIGLIGIYEEVLPPASNVNERKKFLEFFTVWALLKKEVSIAFVVPLMEGWAEEQVLDYISKYSKWFNSPVSGKYVLYHERLKLYLLQKLSEDAITTTLKKIIGAIETITSNEFRTHYIQECSTYYRILAITLKSKEKDVYRTKLFKMALDKAILNEQIELDTNFSKLQILDDSLDVELYFLKEGKMESINKILESYLYAHNNKVDKYFYKLDAINYSYPSDFSDLLLSCFENINVIDSQKLRYLILAKLISHAILNKFDLRTFTDFIIAVSGNISSLGIEQATKDEVNSIIVYGVKLNLVRESLLNHFLGKNIEEAIDEYSNSDTLFQEMDSYHKKQFLLKKSIDDIALLKLSEIIDNEIKENRSKKELSINFIDITTNSEYDFLLHPLLKIAFIESIEKSPKIISDFLENLCENYRFDELDNLLYKLPLFGNINKVSILVKLYTKFQLEKQIINQIKTLLIKYLNQWLGYLSINNNLEINYSVIDYVLKKIDHFDLIYHNDISQKIINQLLKFCRENKINDFDSLFLKFSNSKHNTSNNLVGNSYQIKAMLSRTGVLGSKRQFCRINLIDNYELGIRLITDELTEDFYNSLDILFRKPTKHAKLLLNLTNNYWNIIVGIELIKTFKQYNKYFNAIHKAIDDSQFEIEQTNKNSELYLELLCLAKRHNSELNFIEIFENLLKLKHITYDHLKCACSSIFFYNPFFFKKMNLNLIFSLELKNIIKQRMFLAFLETHKTNNKIENKYIYKLISDNSILTKYYLSL